MLHMFIFVKRGFDMELNLMINLFKTQIEILRKELIETGLKYGLDSSDTLIASQKLDELIFQYQKLHE